MTAMLIVAHAPLASALKAVAMHTFPDCARRLVAMDVPADMSPEDMALQMRSMLLGLNDPEVLVLTDVFGATPCNVAQQLALSDDLGSIKVVTGVNVPMLWRSLCYADDALDALVTRAVAGANQGIMQVAVSKPQNQSNKISQNKNTHDQDPDHHQQ
ncbi:MAG: PTS fructose transporter subunit IIA [Rhizobacter sp.]